MSKKETKKSKWTLTLEMIGSIWAAIGDLRQNVGQVRTSLLLHLEEARVGSEAFRKDLNGLRADVNRAWELAESRNSVHRKADEDLNRRYDELTRVLQGFNERLSKLEGKTSVLDEVRNVTGNQIAMLSECLAAHNQRIWKFEVEHEHPSAIDQMIVDSKLSGVYGKIADLERRLRAAESK